MKARDCAICSGVHVDQQMRSDQQLVSNKTAALNSGTNPSRKADSSVQQSVGGPAVADAVPPSRLVPHPMETTPHQATGSNHVRVATVENAPLFTVFLCTCRNLGERDDTVDSVDTRHIVTADIADLTMVHDFNEYVRIARQSSPAPSTPAGVSLE
jgi:hypothetical protein